MIPFTAVALERCRRSGQPVDLVVRRPGEVTQRLVNVLVVEVSGATVTVEQPDGTATGIEISTPVDANREQGPRRSRPWQQFLCSLCRIATTTSCKGALSALVGSRYPDADAWKNPDLFWRDDRSWFAGTDLDSWSTS